ncbi:hypothetical protein [Acanthopleuribacter pedis]|uniref:Aminotransferase class V domain-containing protein n=1 Tax=Acanthopleuribacter pedis TaxID=442870 RepID=A0A8J7U7I6_9BACT|nr:hypothetical protein [Acanthopleuribacter pedis]MBO1322558.1 hypothetical protein [Acanthopleuribacter pedis]
MLLGPGSLSFADTNPKDIRAQYPWLEHETYLNSAGMMPLSIAAKAALQKYINIQHLGYHRPEEAFRREVNRNTGKLFANMIGAAPNEVTEITCTNPTKIDLRGRLKKAGIRANVGQNRMRISPAQFNNQSDMDKLLNALA